jgi:hypothetical protein
MIDKPYQIGLMRGAIKDYQDGLMPLDTLIAKIEGLLSVIDDKALWDDVFNDFLDLEQINASSYSPDYDFEKHGRQIVQQALGEILAKTESYSR